MNPSIFVSAVTAEHKSLRDMVARVLEQMGYRPERQDIFGTEAGDLRQVLRGKIDDCNGLIQIVGDGYGAEPSEIDVEFGRISYTQFEFLYAKHRDKKTWLLFPATGCTRDMPLDKLDLPRDPTHPNPAAYQSERRALQAAYREKLRASGHLRHGPKSDLEAELMVQRLRDDFAEMREEFRRWQGSVDSAMQKQSDAAQKLAEELAQMRMIFDKTMTEFGTKGVSKDSKRTFAESLREVAQEFGLTAPQLKEAAERFQIYVNNNTTDWQDQYRAKMIQEQYVGAAELAGQTAEKAERELESSRATALEARRREGESYCAAYDFRAAAAAYEKGLALVSNEQAPVESTEFQVRAGNAYLQLGVRCEAAEGKLLLKKAEDVYLTVLDVFTRDRLPQQWASIQNNLGVTLQEMANRADATEAARFHGKAVAAYRASMEVGTRESSPQQWAMTQNNLGLAMQEMASRVQGIEAARLSSEAETAFRSALDVRTRESMPQDWAVTQNNLGVTLQQKASRVDGAESVQFYGEAVTAYRAALEIHTREVLPQAWAVTTMNLGNALRGIAWQVEGAEQTRLYDDAVTALRLVLEVFTRQSLPQYWGMTQNSLGAALRDSAQCTDGTISTRLYGEAVAAYRAALEVRTRDVLPQDWAMTQSNLGNTLREMVNRVEEKEANQVGRQAVDAFRAALDVYCPERLPQQWALTQNDLGSALLEMAYRAGEAEATGLISDAVAAYRAALKVYTREFLPQGWVMSTMNLGNALREMAGRENGTEAARLFGEAVAAYRASLQVDTERDMPARYRLIVNNLAMALNGWAWKLLTSKDEHTRDFKAALPLAQEAAELTESASPSILDTLALALFENGRINEAIATEEKVIILLTKETSDAERKGCEGYADTLARFKAAAVNVGEK